MEQKPAAILSNLPKSADMVDTGTDGASEAANSPQNAEVIAEYCREIETYLCRKNDGHLIRVVGPSFEMVSKWAREGVPLKVAFGGIDRYFERYYRKGPRRRPVRVDFCEADVLDVFDEWRRATGVRTSDLESAAKSPGAKRSPSLPEHLERVLIRLTNAQVTGVLGIRLDSLIQELSNELDRARAAAGGIRGDARRAMSERLVAADASLLLIARQSISAQDLEAMRREVDALVGSVVNQMAPDARDRARERALDQLVRERFHLPTITFS